MPNQERRRILDRDTIGQAERSFVLLEFVIFAFAMIYLLYLIFATINSAAATVGASETQGLDSVFDKISFLLLIRVSILFVVVFLINLLLGFFYLHRLTGPLVRIRIVLNQIADGTIPKGSVALRKGDFPTEVASSLNRALRQIRTWYTSK